MGRRPCCSKEGMNRGAWTALEDKTLTDYINAHGEGKWRHLPTNAGLKRCGKSCRLRWLNYLRPDIKRGNISHDEEDLIIRLHQLLGNKWALIAGRLPGRTDNEIKNYWNTNIVKKVQVTRRHHHHHQNSPPGRDHSNHNHHLSNKNNPLIDPPSNNEPPMVHNMALIMSTNPVPENVDHGHVPMLRDISVDDLIDYGVSYNNTGMSPIPDGEDAVPENFMMDLTVGDLWLSDLLNSEFSDFRDYNYTKNGSIDDNDNNLSSTKMPPPTSDDHQAGILFSNEMLEDWGLCDQNVASHNSFSSFLDNEKEGWL